MAVQANFVTNPFPPYAGAYNGLFSQTNGIVTEDTAGMLKGLKVSTNGIYSGALCINGKSYGLSGAFQADGAATNFISLPAAHGQLTVVMALSGVDSLPQIGGTVSGSNWTASLTADRAADTFAPGEFTMLIPPDANNGPPTNSPAGTGYALITNCASTAKNPASAVAKITGALADGASYSQTVPVSQDGYIPLYASLYGGKGLLLGWINLNVTNTNADTSLAWIRPAGNNFKPYTNGFTNLALTNQILISPWTNSASSLATLADLANLSILDTNFAVNISSAGVVTEAPGESANVIGSVNPKTGCLTVTAGSGPTRVTGHGAILLNSHIGAGYFLATNKLSETLQLTP
jgi:hypothetical protein